MKSSIRSRARQPRAASLVASAVLVLATAGAACAQSAPQAGQVSPLPVPQAASTPAQPAGAASAPTGGVPFPSMVSGAKQPSQPAQGVQIPSSGQPMRLDEKQADQTLQRMDQQVDRRMSGLKIGSGDMAAPDTAPYKTELQQLAEAERQKRLLRAKQEQVDLAIKLWSTVYDPRKEEDQSRAKDFAAPTAAQASEAAAKDAERQREADAQAAAAAKPDLPLPKVVQISGTPGGLHAVLLVPYSGEVTVSAGAQLPGHRRVARITSSDVFVSDPKAGMITLGFGDSVPLAPPMSAVAPPVAAAAVARPVPMPSIPMR